MRLVYLSPVTWESFAQRPHKFVEWFHGRTGGSVLWVDPYPTRFPSWRDLCRSGFSASTNPSGSFPPWLTVLKPGGLPIEPILGSGYINGLMWRRHLYQIDNYAEDSSTLLAVGKPSVLALQLLKRLPHCLSLYDAMDDFPAFYTGLSRFALIRREREIASRVNIILASSSELKSRWVNVHSDVRLVHNGLDLMAVQRVGPTMTSSPQKVFGYVGTIASWFDWGWVCALAAARPNDEIRLIGPVFERPLGKLPANINLLPACDHVTALKAMKQFHVGLIPFRKNALTASVDPIKYYEYRALGLPVISTDFGEMSLRTCVRGVFITHSAHDVSGVADAAIQFGRDVGDASAFAVQNTWEARFDAAELFSQL
ncbi:glycosyltransferase involved in cell wall biosynthesis [Chitinivorax tropicus]|uniref:Glycosyltransferase involved in cell wall biosynthesis n=1 Tax=Chitinivorax tropicus TaxID=714531 RepID=A0A840MSZ0_9PROT|nr:glycosyl transferase [Chitinivorax tropicus]MBB5020525.1 glycosyltransferase involved in cell wall biosynthesis [Chitinivorax tropicus]